jgi:hypothetical protein
VILDVLFYVLLVSDNYYLGDAICKNLQDLKGQDFEQQQAMKQGK